ncbi:MAG: hypothetical protein DSY55_00140 [Clostridia bacterium]|nr:MAG: hypothetical protein DSY55_00140 [Clostridia bacterium]
MIPYKLALKNFLSYKDDQEPLDFSDMHLAMLVGANGHGKSALLDAITWALWGKARAADDELMHLGSAEMQVMFEFGLENQRYSVVRKRHRRGKTSKSMLELSVWDEITGAWQPLTETGVRATQRKIEDILRMDYDTFVHTAFLKQGQADAFTSATPGQRKDILGKVLNLAQYDDYSARAKEMAKDAEQKAGALSGQVQEKAEELGREAAYQEALQRAKAAEMQTRFAKSEADAATSRAQLALKTLEMKQKERDKLADRLARSRTEHQQTETALQKARQRLEKLQEAASKQADVAVRFEQYQEIQAQASRWNEMLAALRPLEQEAQTLQRELDRAIAAVQRDAALAQKQLKDAEIAVAAIPTLAAKAKQVAAEIADLQAQQDAIQARRERLLGLKGEESRLNQEMERLKNAAADLKERLRLLEKGETDACPVCHQPLGRDGREHLQKEYEEEVASLREQYQQVQKQMQALLREQESLQNANRQAEPKLRSLPALQKQWAQLEARLEENRAQEAHLDEMRATVRDLQVRLETGGRPDIQEKLNAVQAQLATLHYDARAHAETRQQLASLQDVPALWQRVQDAAARLPEEAAAVAQLQGRWQREKEALSEDLAELTGLDEALQALPEARRAWDEVRGRQEEAHAAWERAHGALAAAEQRLASLQAVREQHKRLEAALRDVRSVAARYRHLQEAFGPKGIQAMIIEAALPELETEANRLLARLSDGGLQVRLATQREKKTGGVAETLDILISDELGSRPYELYSGGEAFRINLALRIALSRLLARRAGAALQTLFIDEGFGTQDTHGRENLVDAIHMIKDEFALILVITHIEELKDLFPVRIEVTKTSAGGSMYRVS